MPLFLLRRLAVPQCRTEEGGWQLPGLRESGVCWIPDAASPVWNDGSYGCAGVE
jgi:hypothetical protein